jgi:hypothetical protein
MKKSILKFSFFCLLIFIVVSFVFVKYTKMKTIVPVNTSGFAVVELFTSEGCSSCPPADEAVTEIVQEYPNNVYVLGFHVDYWNYLGWKDEFSAAAYSQRQSKYAEVFGLNSIYTPQIVVNGKTQFTGSNKSVLRKTVAEELKNKLPDGIELHAKSSDQKNVVVSYKTNTTDKNIINVVLVQLHTVSTVKRGENKGRNLAHIDIVRDFKTFADNTGTVTLVVPAGLSAKECKVIAFVQNKNDLHVTSANECLIQ